MKWLIFILVIFSCGKHTNPPYQNLADSDGDNSIDTDEVAVGRNPLEADVSALDLVKGIMLVQIDSQQVEIKFSNKSSSRDDLVRLVTSRKKIKKEEIFQDWSQLKMEKKEFATLAPRMLTLKLFFDVEGVTPQGISLVKGEFIKELGVWNPTMEVQLTSDDFKMLMDGTATFRLKANFQEQDSVAMKTYKVFVFDGEKSKVHYVSKSMTFNDFLKHYKIENAKNFDQSNILLMPQSNLKNWWTRSLTGQDHVLVNESPSILKKIYQDTFSSKHFEVKRQDGKSVTFADLKTSPESWVFLKIRMEKIMRLIESRTYPYRGGDYGVECTQYTRNVVSEYSVNLQTQDLINSLVIKTDHETLDLADNAGLKISERVDEIGKYWEVAFRPGSENVTLSLLNRPASTYVLVGTERSICKNDDRLAERRTSMSLVNEERNFDLNIEAHVENLAQ